MELITYVVALKDKSSLVFSSLISDSELYPLFDADSKDESNM